MKRGPRRRVIQLTNSERRRNKLNSLVANAILNKSAQAKARHLTRSGFEHGKWWLFIERHAKAAGEKRFGRIGENIARRQDSPEQVVEEWMDSPTHRANILEDEYRYIGVGFHRRGDDEFWVQHFAGKK